MKTATNRRCTRAEKRVRICEVVNLVVRGKSRADIVRIAAETWGIAERQTESYLAAAYLDLEQSAKFVARRELAKAMARLELIFNRAFEANRWRDALAAQMELIRLVGLDGPHRVELVTKEPAPHDDSLECLTTEEVLTINRLYEQADDRMRAQRTQTVKPTAKY
jgi:hypothetical protein